MNCLQIVEDKIVRKLAQSQANGELASAKGYGEPMADAVGWDETPEEFRMAFKMLKDAGFAPPEIALFHERAALKAKCETTLDADERAALEKKLSALSQAISLRLEALQVRGTL
jgi:hypothetical protein